MRAGRGWGVASTLLASTVLVSTALVSSVLAALAGVLSAASAPLSAAEREVPAAPALEVMSFNLRYADARPPNAWSERRPLVLALLRQRAPDLIGTQEGLYPQLLDIDAGLPQHDWIGLGRDGGSHGEFMAVFYRRDRLQPLEYDHFWLSDTPDAIGSRSWGNRIPRMATWVRFRDRRSGCELYVVNTHLDHETPAARRHAARLLIERIDGFEPGVPVLLAGDFNTGPGDAGAAVDGVHARLTGEGGFVDSWTAAGHDEPGFGSFHDYRGTAGAAGGARIDWILVRGGLDVLAASIDTFEQEGRYPSDHFPVGARIGPPRCR